MANPKTQNLKSVSPLKNKSSPRSQNQTFKNNFLIK